MLAILIILSLITQPAEVDSTEPTIPEVPGYESPELFKENKGQWKDDVLYKANFGSVELYAERGRFLWNVSSPEDLRKRSECTHSHDHTCDFMNMPIRSHGFAMELKNNNPDHTYKGKGASSHISNYFIGTKENWATDVRDYEKIEYGNIYSNIDLQLYTLENQLKYDFIVNPGGNPKDIIMDYKGLEKITLENGELVLKNSINTFSEKAPFAYQIIDNDTIKIDCKFSLNGTEVSFKILDDYHTELPLVIDPVLVFSSYSGSSADNWGMTATPGANGELYAGGIVFSTGYPIVGAYQSQYSSDFQTVDMGISKFAADGRSLLYSTYLGGSKSDFPHSLIENSRGELVILGSTSSDNFPVRSNAYDRFHNGYLNNPDAINGILTDGSDIVVSVLSPNGNALRGSTYIGGSNDDGVNIEPQNFRRLTFNYGDEIRGEVVIDDNDNIYVSSVSGSEDFPVTQGAMQQFYGGGPKDAVIFSLTRDCSDLRFSTFYGGAALDAAYTIKLNSRNELYVAGGTESRDLRMVGNPIKNRVSQVDGFVAHISPDGKSLLNSTFIGTSFYDQIYFLDLDVEGNPYIYGQTSGDFPMSDGVFGNPGSGQFVQKLSKNLSQVELSTTFGSGNNEINISPTAFLVDTCGRIYMSGWGGEINNFDAGNTNNMTTTNDAYIRRTDGDDFYLIVMEENFRSLLYATYFGAYSLTDEARDHVDGGTSRFAKDGTVYHAVCAGCRGSSEYPATNGVVSETNNSSNCNLGVFKFDFQLSEINARIDLGIDTSGCIPFTVNFTNNSTGTQSFEWDFGDGNTSNEKNPDHEYQEDGIYQVRLIAQSSNVCVQPDTAYETVNVRETIEGERSDTSTCTEEELTITSSQLGIGAEYEWNTGESTPTITVDQSGKYIVNAYYLNCIYPDTIDVEINTPNIRIENTVHCSTADLIISVDDRAQEVNWNTGEIAKSIQIDSSGTYSVNYTINDCIYSDTAVIVLPVLPSAAITGDTLACSGDQISLVATNNSEAENITFNWSTGDTGETTEVSSTGTYSVTVTEENGCQDIAEHYVYFIPELEELNPDLLDTLICNNSELRVDFSAYSDLADIEWFDGSNEFVRTFDEPGDFPFRISNICEEITDEISLKKSPYDSDELPLYFPNAFTPNKDGINDVFKPEYNPKDVDILSYTLRVYDRWGNLLFESQNIGNGWNGNHKEKLLKPGVYVYTADINFFTCEEPSSKFIKGDVQLLN